MCRQINTPKCLSNTCLIKVIWISSYVTCCSQIAFLVNGQFDTRLFYISAHKDNPFYVSIIGWFLSNDWETNVDISTIILFWNCHSQTISLHVLNVSNGNSINTFFFRARGTSRKLLWRVKLYKAPQKQYQPTIFYHSRQNDNRRINTDVWFRRIMLLIVCKCFITFLYKNSCCMRGTNSIKSYI